MYMCVHKFHNREKKKQRTKQQAKMLAGLKNSTHSQDSEWKWSLEMQTEIFRDTMLHNGLNGGPPKRYIHVPVHAKLLHLCPTLCDPMD